MTPEQQAKHKATMAKWREQNAEKFKAYSKNYRDTHDKEFAAYNSKWRKNNRATINVTRTEWNAANPERVRVMSRKSWHKNKEKYLDTAYKKYWADPDSARQVMRESYYRHLAKNRIMARIYAHNRRVAIGKGPRMAPDTTYRLMAEQNGRCVHCPANLMEVDFHIDHILAISKGGLNNPENLQLLCASCNDSKKNHDEKEWLKKRAARNAKIPAISDGDSLGVVRPAPSG